MPLKKHGLHQEACASSKLGGAPTDLASDSSRGRQSHSMQALSVSCEVWTGVPPRHVAKQRVQPFRHGRVREPVVIGICAWLYSWTHRRSCALTATMTVLADINTAATAGGKRMPCVARTPAANGIATRL